jgi:DNA-binding MarR family transcriptional regulator
VATQRVRLAATAWGALLRVHAGLVPVMDRTLRNEAGLPLTWYDVLLELTTAPNQRLRMSELGERVVLSRTRVSRLVDELAGAGLVRRDANPDDARSSFAVLTAAGRAAYRRAAPIYLRAITRHFAAGLTVHELETIADGLTRVADRIDATPPLTLTAFSDPRPIGRSKTGPVPLGSRSPARQSRRDPRARRGARRRGPPADGNWG